MMSLIVLWKVLYLGSLFVFSRNRYDDSAVALPEKPRTLLKPIL